MAARRERIQRPAVSVIDCIDSEQLFASHFRDAATWTAWRCFLKVLFGHPLSAPELELFQQCTGRTQPNRTGYNEAWLTIGRRGGESFVLALCAVYCALFKDWRHCLNVGETGTVVIIAADRKQARVTLNYAKGLISSVPMLAREVVSETTESITLRNRICLEVHACSYKSVRGYTILVSLLDEVSYWTTDEDAAEPDSAVLEAIRPGMATVPGAMLLVASSPYSRKGILWNAYKDHYGKDSSAPLVWKAPTVLMHPTRKVEEFVERAYADDPISAAAEYGAEFRTDIESFVLREVIDACVTPNVYERAPIAGIAYHSYVDPSGGTSDSFTIAVAHKEKETIVLDALRERRPPFNPESVVAEFAALLKSYKITKVTGDRFAGSWPTSRFAAHGISYVPCERTKSDLYKDFLPLLNSGKVDLIDNGKMINQLVSLERRTTRAGKDLVDHALGAHDDLADATAGAAVLASSTSSYSVDMAWVSGDGDQDALDAWRRMELQQILFQR